MATYSDDANYGPATSPNFTQNVGKATPTVAVSTDNPNATYGQTINLTATVTGVPGAAVPGGTVSFTADGNSLYWISINVTKQSSDSTAVCTISVGNNNLLTGGSHIIVATYSDGQQLRSGDFAELYPVCRTGDAHRVHHQHLEPVGARTDSYI